MMNECVEDTQLGTLLARAQEGEAGAIESLLLRYRPALLDNALRLRQYANGAMLDVDDLQQEGMIALIEAAMDRSREPADNLDAYLKQKVRWRLINYIRRERRKMSRKAELNEDIVDGVPNGSIPCSSQKSPSPRLKEAMKQLSPKQKSILFKLYWQDSTPEEIASELRISQQSVRALRKRAETRIKKHY
ncbi:MAG: sigma-70 family RNA polymerase sigma factor [Chloroflexi bacterium]|nr:sigma-70 family RNA polymerase sigma factor [Chloroflexota bacterium]MDA8188623.1 sigma-70 family RNA polymerase sigma factor [Dehalococcoidales bacterium]